MPLQATSGAASYDAFGGGVAAVPNYIEDVFSTWLYTGNGSTQTINNGIDLAGKGGLVWSKLRSTTSSPIFFDTARGVNKGISSDSAGTEFTTSGVTSFNTNGYAVGSDGNVNANNQTAVGWTFRKQAKFFDVQVAISNGTSVTFNHALGSEPGFVMILNLDLGTGWKCYHRSLGVNDYLVLSTTAAAINASSTFANVTNTTFTLNQNASSGNRFVAYLFAHNAGGFGLTGTDNVISCGSFTTSTVSDTITLGYEPQWVLAKAANSATNWYIFDNMRGLPTGGSDLGLKPNSSAAESADANFMDLTATGFTSNFQAIFGDGINIIYIAIRRGPMKVPTDGTKVFSPNLSNAVSGTAVTTGFPLDLQIVGCRPNYALSVSNAFMDRLRGVSTISTQVGNFLAATSTDAEVTNAATFRTLGWGNTGYNQDTYLSGSGAGIYWNFRRAPGFFDEVCYTGVGGVSSLTHNLAATPELIIVKSRSSAEEWFVWHSSFAYNQYLFLNRTDAMYTSPGGTEYFGTSAPVATATTFNVGANAGTNGTNNFVAYLFATCPGVSKVGTYSGNGGTQAIACGFTGGARFVLIKRTNTSGEWYVYDTTRGMTTSTSPNLRLNSTAAEQATLGSVTTTTGGFTLDASVLSAINNSGSSYIFLAIA